MKIRHSLAHYILYGFVLFVVFGSAIVDDTETKLPIFFSGLMILGFAMLDYFSSYIEVKNGMVRAHVGMIKRQSLSTPIGNINGCEVKKFLFWNRLKITSGLTLYVFKNMKNIDEFTRELEKQNLR